jgi:hypothetical protein
MRASKNITLGLVTMPLLMIGAMGAAMAQVVNDPEHTYTTEQISVGNAGSECSQLGTLLGTTYVYAYKWNENGETLPEPNLEGAPNGDETASFADHSNTITISGSNGLFFDWSSTNSIGAVMVKASTGYNVYTYIPQAMSDTGLYAYEGKGISHVSFCWNPDAVPQAGEWCSPGYWRQEHHLDSWTATGYAERDLFAVVVGYAPKLSKLGERANAEVDPTLLQVLQSPQYYGGDAFNAVGDLLSEAHPDVDFTGTRVEDSCPLN